jgi:hypothetical protein
MTVEAKTAEPAAFQPESETAAIGASVARPRVRVYLDDADQPIVDRELPAEVALDTTELADGAHRLTIIARGESGREGIHEVPFIVRNGPGIVVSGLKPNSTRRGKVQFTVAAFSAEDPFDPRRAEAHSSIPVWVWVLSLFIVAWAVWYAARMWDVPSQYAATPTYGTEMTVPAPAPK